MIPLFKVHMPADVDQALLDTLHSGYITQGAKVEEFEKELGIYFANDKVLTLNSCTSALTLALRLSGVGYDDEVITTPMTCSATNLPILALGGKPVFADVDPDTGLIDAADVNEKITPKTKAVIAVDWGGAPADVEGLIEVTRHLGIKLIIDAAHAMHRRDTSADFTCYSLQAIKHITTADGGILVCREQADYEQGKLLRWFGIKRDADSMDSRISEDITRWGYKFHMNDVNATIGLVQMRHLRDVLLAYRSNALAFNHAISDYFIKPPSADLWVYTLLLPGEELRDRFKEWMAERGIQVSQVHRRNDEYTVFRQFATDLPGVSRFANRMICLPVHYGLSVGDLNAIIDACNQFAEAHS